MASRVEITQGDILEALSAAIGSAPSEARTREELAKASGLSTEKVRRALGLLAAQGRLSVFKVFRPGIDGRNIYRPGYAIRPAPKGK